MDDLPNIVGDDHELLVKMAFARREGEQTTAAVITLREDADYLDKMLAAMTQFLQQLGFTYVGGLTAHSDEGNEICSS